VYACVCRAVTESDVRACHEAGMRDVRQIARATRAGSGCGSCVSRLRAILAATNEAEASASAETELVSVA
jgi:bacterioferritin-associated ferredoxin